MVHALTKSLRVFLVSAGVLLAAGTPARAGDFSVSPIRAELKAGVLSETITVTNNADMALRVSVKLQEWTQDASGNDVYQDTTDLVYFPRQMDIGPNAKRLVRIGAKTPAGVQERAYRLFIEEEPDTASRSGTAQVAFYFRFGVPVFVAPAVPRQVPEVLEPVLASGKLTLQVRNAGNKHFRISRIAITDNVGYAQEVAGWYSLADTQRVYTALIPVDVCRRAKSFSVRVEGEGLNIERSVDVEPSRCS